MLKLNPELDLLYNVLIIQGVCLPQYGSQVNRLRLLVELLELGDSTAVAKRIEGPLGSLYVQRRP